jgi:hypothetical protein
VRVDGAWSAGHVHAWVRTPDGWVMWVQYRVAGVTWALWDWFIYGPAAVRERHGAEAPD